MSAAIYDPFIQILMAAYQFKPPIIPVYNTTVTSGGPSVFGVTVTGNPLVLSFDAPFVNYAPFPGTMQLYKAGAQIAQVDFDLSAVGAPCKIIYLGKIYLLTFQTGIVNI